MRLVEDEIEKIYFTKDEANAAIINDMLSKHPGYTIDQYFVHEENKNLL